MKILRCQTGSVERTDHFVLSIWNPKQLKILGKDLRLYPTVFAPYSWNSTFLLFTLLYSLFSNCSSIVYVTIQSSGLCRYIFPGHFQEAGIALWGLWFSTSIKNTVSFKVLTNLAYSLLLYNKKEGKSKKKRKTRCLSQFSWRTLTCVTLSVVILKIQLDPVLGNWI